MSLIAVTRAVSASIARCELTHISRAPIDLERARAQHDEYEKALVELGCAVIRLDEEPELPDAVFVEDTAVVLDEIAVLTRPGAESRRREVASVRAILEPWRTCVDLTEPATLDGGDVLRLGRSLWVGLSSRSNREGVRQLRQALAPHGYAVEGVELKDCLHLKSAVTEVAPGVVLHNPAWIDPAVFGDLTAIAVDPDEPFAANGLLLGRTVLYPSAFPQTQARLQREEVAVRTIDVSELAKAEGAVTCCSLVFAAKP